MDYYTTMGVRDGETDWKKKINLLKPIKKKLIS